MKLVSLQLKQFVVIVILLVQVEVVKTILLMTVIGVIARANQKFGEFQTLMILVDHVFLINIMRESRTGETFVHIHQIPTVSEPG
uniref:Putative secreted protein n=1 Tax=Xenopsylla cheopis TaxID=163159 RepID=A0A6M2DXB9_XENCH